VTGVLPTQVSGETANRARSGTATSDRMDAASAASGVNQAQIFLDFGIFE
jgi:hypothetical protein